MADQNAVDRRQFFQRLRPRVAGSAPAGAGPGERADQLPSNDPAVVRRLVVDWQPDVAASWEESALLVFTQAGAMLRWDLSAAEAAFLRPVNGELSIGALHDAVAVDGPDTLDAFGARIRLLTELLEARVLRVVRGEAARAASPD